MCQDVSEFHVLPRGFMADELQCTLHTRDAAARVHLQREFSNNPLLTHTNYLDSKYVLGIPSPPHPTARLAPAQGSWESVTKAQAGHVWKPCPVCPWFYKELGKGVILVKVGGVEKGL